MGLKIFINGEFVEKENAKISVFDHGLLYGDGVFEGIRSYNRKVFRLEQHLDRLYKGADIINLKVPLGMEEFQDKIIETLKINGLDNAYIRAVVTRGVGDLGLDPRKCAKASVFIITDKISLYPEDFYEKGLPIIIAKTRHNHFLSMNPKVKSLNYLNNILARIEATQRGVPEALMLSVEGHITECTGDNIFIVKKGKLYTPPCGVEALEGITQKAVFEIAQKKDLEVIEREILSEFIFTANECFLTGTAAEVVPVVKVDDKIIGDGKPGILTMGFMKDFKELTKQDGVAY